MSCIRLNIIAAVADNDAIGRDNALLWHIREDLQYFKKVTLGCPVIMGRRTFMSLGKPLPGRLNIVVTRSGEIRSSDKAASVRKGSDGIQVAWSIEDAVRIAERSLSYEEFRKAEEGSEADRPLAALDNLVPDNNPALQTDRIDTAAVPDTGVERNIFIIGGGEIYRQTMPLADRLYITEVHAVVKDADTFFPEIDRTVWKEVSRSETCTDTASGLGYEFVIYERIR